MPRFAKAALLLSLFTLCAAAILVTHRVRQHLPAPLPHELYSVVNSQLAAFRAHDFCSAYRYAASGVQQKFPLPQYEAMIRRDYGNLATASHIEFGSVNVKGPSGILQVFCHADDGAVRLFLYSLSAENGAWKIDGAEEVPVPHSGRRLAGVHI